MAHQDVFAGRAQNPVTKISVKGQIISFLAGALFLSTATGGAVAAPVGAEAADPCISISTAAELNSWIRKNLRGSFCLTRDIDVGAIRNFKPIGDFGNPFRGVLDGKGHKILNLRIHRTDRPAALFISVLGTVKNLGLVNVDIKTTGTGQTAAALAAELDSFQNVEGIVFGKIENSFSTGTIVREGPFQQAGGLVGLTDQHTIISNSYSRASVRIGAYGFAGGLVGSNAFSATIQDSFATGRVSGGANAQAGGLIGNGGGTILRSFAKGRVSVGDNGVAGGLAGVALVTLRAVYATGQVSGGASSTVGGLVGLLSDASDTTRVSLNQSYATGKVGPVGANSRVGGLVAWRNGGRIRSSYWDVNTSGIRTSSGGAGLPTRQLQGRLPTGFSEQIWKIRPDRYPTLK